jgi:hypothetical protein
MVLSQSWFFGIFWHLKGIEKIMLLITSELELCDRTLLGAVMSLKLRPGLSKLHADAVVPRISVSEIAADPQIVVAMVT